MSILVTRSTRILRSPTRFAGSVRLFSSSTGYEYIVTSRPDPSVALITLNRPKALNALSSPLFLELNKAVQEADADKDIGAIVLTGSEKAFAGALVHVLAVVPLLTHGASWCRYQGDEGQRMYVNNAPLSHRSFIHVLCLRC